MPERGVSFYHDVVEATFLACQELCGYDISALTKQEQDSLFAVTIDVWTNWPEDNEGVRIAVEHALWSMAVADGWEEVLLYLKETA